jgi:serine/threonine-protein kinase
MDQIRYQALGPLLAGEGSRAFLGLAVTSDQKARPVVIVWVPESATRDASLLRQIKRETEHAAKLDHPNIVNVIGFAELEEGQARVVEFADGESLRKVLQETTQLPLRIAARIVCDACTGTHYAHVAGNDDGTPLVHGGLRPETILVSFGGITKVTGYGGLAFAPSDPGDQTVKGRRVHSAPEQIIGGREAISIPTDVYLLGLLAYELLTGTVPWADQADGFDHAVLTHPLPPARPGVIPPELEAVIARACAKKAADRFQTPLALRDAIEAAVGGEIATLDELSTFLESLFPQSHQLRADRRHTIDAGIADFVRRKWIDQEKADTMPTTRAVSPTPAESRKSEAPPSATGQPPVDARPVPAAPPLHHPPRRHPLPTDVSLTDARGVPDTKTPRLIMIAVVVAVVAIGWAIHKAREPLSQSPRPLSGPVATTARPTDAVEPTASDAGPTLTANEAAPTDGGDELSKLTIVDAGPTIVLPTPPPAPLAAAPPSELDVRIDSSPTVELFLEGASLGMTPWKGILPPGRKVFALKNPALGINTTRVITVKTSPVDEQITLDKGFVTVAAPDGAVVFFDGIRAGTAPLKGDVALYEGAHRISVTVGKAKWGEAFTLRADQRMSFNVEME